MAKQEYHLKKINNLLVGSGRGTKDSLVGSSVWYDNEVYVVSKKNKNNTYDLKNLTFHKEVKNVKRINLIKY